MTRSHDETTASPPVDLGGPVATVRRLVVYALLLVMVVIAAIGLSGLLGELFGQDPLIVGDSTHLARLLAFSLIGTPLALGLWWFGWREGSSRTDRHSVAWALYAALVYLIALVVATVSLLGCLDDALSGRWSPGELANAIVWGGVFVWHAWMLQHPVKGPTRMRRVAVSLGALFGLVLMLGWAITLVGRLLTTAIDGLTAQTIVGTPWWMPTLQALVWMLGGAAIWWWHWSIRHVRVLETGFDRVLHVLITALGLLGTMLVGAAGTLHLLLRLAVGDGPDAASLGHELGPLVAAALLGAVAFVFYRRRTAGQDEVTARAAVFAASGLSVVGAASGLGVVVNAALAAAVQPIAGSGRLTLLLGGLAALIVFGISWWIQWRPLTAATPDRSATPGRRVFLVAIFGVSALVAMIALLVVGYRIFEFVLAPVSTGAGLLELTRAPLGVLVATLFVAIYHFALWRRDLAVGASSPAPARTINAVLLVGGDTPLGFAAALTEATGARLTVLRPADGGHPVETAAVIEALRTVSAPGALVIARESGAVEVIPLQE